MFSRPKPRREFHDPARLTFDARLQLRALPAGLLADPATAQQYADAIEQGEQFPPLELVSEKPAKGKRLPALWVFAGFTRGAAYTIWGKAKSVECLVYDGTFEDALFFALAENARHGVARTSGDKRRAIATLLDTPGLMERVRSVAPKNGGMHRAIAAACGVGASTVSDELRARGLSVEGIRLVVRIPVAIPDSNQTVTLCGPHKVEPSLEQHVSPSLVISPSALPSVALPAQSAPVPPDATGPTVASPDEGDGTEAVPVVDGEPLYTATPPGPVATEPAAACDHDICTPEVIADLKPAFAATRAKADRLIRALKEVNEATHEYLASRAGDLMQKVTVNGRELFAKRTVTERIAHASIARSVWAHPWCVQFLELVRRTRAKATCAACRGEGCRACRGLGFLPEDESILKRDEQLAFDLGDPFEVVG